MVTPRDKYYMKMYDTLVDYNDHNDAPFSNDNIWQAIHKVIAIEESDAHKITLDAHNVTADNFSQMTDTPNTQGEDENAILTSERLYKLDALA